MNLNKVAIVYISYTNNTKLVAESIKKYLVDSVKVDVFNFKDDFNLEDYDFVFLGCFTWDKGTIPTAYRRFLKNILVENHIRNQYFSVFGTGDTQWGELYCRAVDEMEYHLNKQGKTVIEKLKIEQKPISNYNQNIIKEYVNKIKKEVIRLNDKSN